MHISYESGRSPWRLFVPLTKYESKVGEPTWMFCCILSLILSPIRDPGQHVANQRPSPILEEMSHSKTHGQNSPMQTAIKQVIVFWHIRFESKAHKGHMPIGQDNAKPVRYVQKCRLMRCMIWKWHFVMLIHKEHWISLACISGHKWNLSARGDWWKRARKEKKKVKVLSKKRC